MKAAFLCLIIILNFKSLFSQNDSTYAKYVDFVEIEVYDGLTVRGTTSVKILYEGLLLRNTCTFCDKANDTIIFLQWNPDLLKKQFTIRKYILDNHIYDIKGDIRSETFYTLRRPTVFKIYMFDGNLRIFYYYDCNEKIDKLLRLINKLIPVEYRDKISFILKC